jgi:hypothetical protein
MASSASNVYAIITGMDRRHKLNVLVVVVVVLTESVAVLQLSICVSSAIGSA